MKITFDTGVKEFEINNNGVLRFNPGDPNVYARFFDAAEQIQSIEEELEAKGKSLDGDEASGEKAIRFIQEADKKVKELLGQVFGHGNDFDKLLGGVNILAVAGNGERVVTNLMHALLPIVEQGAKRCFEQKVETAVGKAKGNRAARRANK